ncbi:hypothetical protein [Ferrimonas kyonanensis]|uniref:hypothetical protein n=1 Tax=Ferrimonas kyonanensis TaxID=364763 RepID=UPI000482F815|nr:hypothetical protein [Ferrimonas kyonanensis]
MIFLWGLALFSVILVLILMQLAKNKQLRDKCGLSFGWILLYTDLESDKLPKSISRDGVRGRPDAIFFNPFRWRLLVVEYKSRSHRGNPGIKAYEFYQVQLYIGMMRRWYKPPIQGLLQYRDGREVVHFNPEVYANLVGPLRDELLHYERVGVIPNPNPLHRRLRR